MVEVLMVRRLRWSSSRVYKFISKWLGFGGGIEINLIFVCVSKLTLFLCPGWKWLGFSVGIEIDLFFVCMVEMDLILVWGIESDLILE